MNNMNNPHIPLLEELIRNAFDSEARDMLLRKLAIAVQDPNYHPFPSTHDIGVRHE